MEKSQCQMMIRTSSGITQYHKHKLVTVLVSPELGQILIEHLYFYKQFFGKHVKSNHLNTCSFESRLSSRETEVSVSQLSPKLLVIPITTPNDNYRGVFYWLDDEGNTTDYFNLLWD